MKRMVLHGLCVILLATLASPSSAQISDTAIGTVEIFIASGFPIDEVFVYTEAKGTLLGRPGQFVEKVVWHDTRLTRETDSDGDLVLDSGGTIERFRSRQDLQTRVRYVETFDGTILSTQDYRFEIGLMLLRLPFALTPSQAEEYRRLMAG